MRKQILSYKHDLDPASVWLMVNSNQFARVSMPQKSIPYIQELGDFLAGPGFFTQRKSLASYLLKYTISGEGILEYDGNTYTVREGDAFWIDCQKFQHYYTSPKTGRWHVIWMHFYGESCSHYYELFLAQNNGSPVISLPPDNLVESQLKGLLAVYSQDGLFLSQSNSPLEISPQSDQFQLDELSEAHAMSGMNVMRDIQASGTISSILISCINATICQDYATTPDVAKKAQLYMSEHFSEPLTLDSISRKFGVNKYYFVRLFKRYNGYTPTEYIIMERIHHAKSLLRSTDGTISSIADMVGFSNVGHFINMFKREVGVTPGVYRSSWK